MKIEDKYAETVSVVHAVTLLDEEYQLPIDHDIKKHITLTILGQIPDISVSQAELVSVLKTIPWESVDDIQVHGLGLFGPNSDFLVLKLDSAAINRNHKLVVETLFDHGIPVIDQYQTFSPHITLAHEYQGSLPQPSSLPQVEIIAPTLWWGTEKIAL